MSQIDASQTPILADGEWPNISGFELYAVIGAPILGLIASYIYLRILYPPPSKEQLLLKKKQDQAAQEAKTYNSLEDPAAESASKVKLIQEGEELASYDDYDWTKEFDFIFLVFMIVMLVILLIATAIYMPELFTNGQFWLLQLPKLAAMMIVSLVGGALCRYMCMVDDQGYIQTGERGKQLRRERGLPVPQKKSWFKVNYTRKLQHFAAYAVPLFIKSNVKGTLALIWGDWFTMLGFLIQIKPIREMPIIGPFFMIQYNSLDRPEDRPNTIKWIIGGNILPGLCCIILFRYLYSFNNTQDLAFIWIFVTGIGDGLAEPVGITWGRHKYWTSSLFSGADDVKYQRSWEGSACVFLSAMVFTSMYWYAFQNALQFWLTMIILPPLMAYAEATSPHTMDTPFLMGLGGLLLLAVGHIPSW